MSIPGQRSAQKMQTASVQSARALGRAASPSAGTSEAIIYKKPDGTWVSWAVGPDGLEVETPYDMSEG